MKLREKKGLTLVELIVSVALTAVIIAAACSALYVGAHSFQNGSVNAYNQQRAALAESYLQRYASTAKSASAGGNSEKSGVFFSVKDGVFSVTRQTGSDSGKTRTEEASVDGIAKMEGSVSSGVLHYILISQDGSYRLTGGIVLNNAPSAELADFTVQGDSVFFLEL